MRVVVVSIGGDPLASLDAEPTWSLSEVLGAVREHSSAPALQQVKLLHGTAELHPGRTLEEIGVAENSQLTCLFGPPFPALHVNGQRDAAIWNLATGEHVRALEVKVDIFAWSFSPDGQWLSACQTDGNVTIWSVDSEDCLHTLQHDYVAVQDVAFSHDGQLAATCAGNEEAKLWSVSSGICLWTLHQPGSTLEIVIFSPSDQLLFTGSGQALDVEAGLWDVTSGQRRHTLQDQAGGIYWAAFSPDSRKVATVCFEDDARIKIWCADQGNLLRTLNRNIGSNTPAFSPDSEMVAATDGGAIKIWSVASGQCLLTLLHSADARVTSTGAVFSPDGQLVLTACSDGTAKVWNATSGESVHTWDVRQTFPFGQSRLRSAVFSPTGQEVFIDSADGTGTLWSVASGECLHKMQGAGCVEWRVPWATIFG